MEYATQMVLAVQQSRIRKALLLRCFQVWIEFGRIKLPQGYHPNDVEEEWGKLIIEMLEREKSLRPAVERLVLNCVEGELTGSLWRIPSSTTTGGCRCP